MKQKLRVIDIEDPTVVYNLIVDGETGQILKWTTIRKNEKVNEHATIS